MSLDFNDIVRQGYLKLKSKKLGVWHRRWVIFRRPSSKGPRRLDKYIDERCAMTGSGRKIIELTGVKSIARLPTDVKKCAAAIHFNDGTSRSFACESDMEVDMWVKNLMQECLELPASLRNVDLLDSGPSQREFNDRFHVYLLPTPNLGISGECILQVTTENILLLDASNLTRRLVTWPLNALRRYGRDDNKFTFEAGRFCDTGEGLFILNTTEGEQIYQKVHSATLAIAEAHRIFSRQQQKRSIIGTTTRSLPPTPTESNFKTARSRSLPPVPPPAFNFEHGDIPEEPPPPPPRPLPPEIPERPPLSAPPRTGYVEPDGAEQAQNNGATSLQELLDKEIGASTEEDEELEYIYEEKGLNPAFRKFLHNRKQAEGDESGTG